VRKSVFAFLLALSLFLCATVTMAETPPVGEAPEWVRYGESIRASDIRREDYQYLASWLNEHAKPPQEYVIGLFDRHQVVIVGEAHNVKEHKDFVIDLIPRLYHEAGVRCIGWEFSRHTDNQRLERLVTAPDFDYQAVLDFARGQLAGEFNSKEHWDMVEAVWRLNRQLEPSQEKMRFVGLDMDVDLAQWTIIERTRAKGSAEFQHMLAKVLRRDRTMAEQVKKEIIDKDQKGLVFVGRCHDFTHYQFPKHVNFGRDIMGSLLHREFEDRVFQVWPSSGIFPIVEKVMEIKGHEPLGFDLYASPFANILTPSSWYDAPDVPLSRVARGYVYLGPRANLHSNTAIKGFVTDSMFEKHKDFYQTCFGRPFKNAAEVDRYLQEHRWPSP